MNSLHNQEYLPTDVINLQVALAPNVTEEGFASIQHATQVADSYVGAIAEVMPTHATEANETASKVASYLLEVLLNTPGSTYDVRDKLTDDYIIARLIERGTSHVAKLQSMLQ